MPTRHLHPCFFDACSFILSGKVCFEGFVVRIEQMFPCRFSFTGRLCGLLYYCTVASCGFLAIFALSEMDL